MNAMNAIGPRRPITRCNQPESGRRRCWRIDVGLSIQLMGVEMPAQILPFGRTSTNQGLPVDEFSELDADLVLLTFSLERASHPDFPEPSHAQLAALARHAVRIQGRFQDIARRTLTFAGCAPDPSEFCLNNPAIDRLQRAALFGDSLDNGE